MNRFNSSWSYQPTFYTPANQSTFVTPPNYSQIRNSTLHHPYFTMSPISMILTAIPVVFIIIVIVFGNALVVLAVLSQERLKRKTQNWLIVSLAVADLLVGLLIMPFTLAYELLGRWTFGRAFCEMWLASDVLFVTASIMNLCAISIDRYWSLTDPVHYSATMTTPKARVRIATMIGCSWLLAFLICLPPLVGWRPVHGDDHHRPATGSEVEEFGGGGCNLSEHLGYVIYSAFGSFFVPLTIVVFIYVKIFVLTRRRITAQRRKAKQRDNLLMLDAPGKPKAVGPAPAELDDSVVGKCSSGGSTAPRLVPQTNSGGAASANGRAVSAIGWNGPTTNGVASAQNGAVSATVNGGPLVEDDGSMLSASASDCTTSAPNGTTTSVAGSASAETRRRPMDLGLLMRHRTSTTGSGVESKPSASNNGIGVATQTDHSHIPRTSRIALISRADTLTSQSMAADADTCQTPLVDSATNSNPVFASRSSTSVPKATTTTKVTATSATNGAGGQNRMSVCAPALLLRPLELQLRMMQQRKGVRRRERQATLVLGLILGAFVLSWMPFFCSYVLSALCCQTPEIIFDVIFWLGYCNSGLNPFIYNFFNPDFRNAFRRILCRKAI